MGCAMFVWIRLAQVAYQTGQTIYQVKYRGLADFLRQQLKAPHNSNGDCVSPIQKKELALQREELANTREEIKGQKEQLEAQNQTL